MPPMLPPCWGTCHGHSLQGKYFSRGCEWTLEAVPIRANGQPGFAFYRLDEALNSTTPFALQVLTIEKGLVVNATTFGFPALFQYFGLPAII